MSQGRIAEGSDASLPGQVRVANIFKVSEDNLRTDDDNQVFNNLHNHWLLFHGTKNENLMGIL
jgi:hypothetical protein